MIKKFIFGAKVSKIALFVVVVSILVCTYVFYLPNPVHEDKLRNLAVVYDSSIKNNPTQQQFIAEHFDTILTGRTLQDTAYNIKQLNPDIIILGYYSASFTQDYHSDWDYVNQQEGWFFHDIHGNRIQDSQYGAYLMNITSGWKDYYATRSVEFLDDYLQYSGIFADNCNGHLNLGQFTVPDEDIPQYIWDNWYDWMYAFIEYAYNNITDGGTNDRIYLTNSGRYYEFCNEITGRHILEGFVHNRGHLLTELGWAEGFTHTAIGWLHNVAEEGNIVHVISGTVMPDNPTSEELEQEHQWMIYCLCCYLFAVEDMEKSYFAWQFWGQDDTNGYYPEMDYPFGNPLNQYYSITGSVYARDFENAIIVANLSPDTTYTVNINGTNYELGRKTGLIIPTN